MDKTLTRDLYISLRNIALGVANSNNLAGEINLLSEPTSLSSAPLNTPLVVMSDSLIIYPSGSRDNYSVERMLKGSTLIKVSSKTRKHMFNKTHDLRVLKHNEELIYIDTMLTEKLTPIGPNLVDRHNPSYVVYNKKSPDVGLVCPMASVILDDVPLYNSQQEASSKDLVKVFDLFDKELALLDQMHEYNGNRYLFRLKTNMKVEMLKQTRVGTTNLYTTIETRVMEMDYSTGLGTLTVQEVNKLTI